jgi:hypothetical protein
VSLPVPIVPQLTGKWSQACIMLRMLCFPDVHFAPMVAVLTLSVAILQLTTMLEHTWDRYRR